jgi:hypothetical protein
VNEKKYVLEQVIGFGIVPENLVPDRTHQARVATKETGQGFLIPGNDAGHQDFIGDFSARSRPLNRGRRGTGLVFFGKAIDPQQSN